MLKKDHLWEALKEYPDAKRVLINRGRQLLQKDNMLDEEIAKRQDMEEETTEQKVLRLEGSIENIYTRFARLLADYNTTQLRLKQRIKTLEDRVCSLNKNTTSDEKNGTIGQDSLTGPDGGQNHSSDTLAVPMQTNKKQTHEAKLCNST